MAHPENDSQNGANASTGDVEARQRAAFIQWYSDEKGGSKNAVRAMSSAIGKVTLKNGTALFAITDYSDLDIAIKNSKKLNEYFQNRGGGYQKMNTVFNIPPECQLDDLKSGIKYYLEFLKEKSPDGKQEPTDKTGESFSMDKNIILFGVPGTGKTYSSIQYAVSIIEGKSLDDIKKEDYDEVLNRYRHYKDNGLIAFTTFHQSFGYEEFIEGIRPVLPEEGEDGAEGEIKYELHDGVFKEFCNNAVTPVGNGADIDLGFGKNPTVWKVSLERTGDNPTRTECMENNHIRIGWDEYGETISDSTDYSEYGGNTVLNAFYDRMQIGDIVFSCYSSKTIDAIGVVTGDPEWHDDYSHYKRLRNVKWLAKGLNEVLLT
ncbi:MAG: hypothetical protein LBU76_08815 [Azoarcus sp.]|jgi:hypothetical protein|nr:hypothetical protein [Azoarcus sp.]